MPASVLLLHGAAEQKPVSHVLMGVTMEELLPEMKMEMRGEGLRHAAAEGLDATLARALRQPDEIDVRLCLL
jgi:hypothetical protein